MLFNHRCSMLHSKSIFNFATLAGFLLTASPVFAGSSSVFTSADTKSSITIPIPADNEKSYASPVLVYNSKEVAIPVKIAVTGSVKASTTCNDTLAPLSQCWVFVESDPTSAKSSTGHLFVNSGAGSIKIPLVLSDTAKKEAIVSFSSSNADILGISSNDLTLTLHNTGKSSLVLGELTSLFQESKNKDDLDYPNANDFDIPKSSNGCYLKTLAPGKSCNFKVEFKPGRNGLITSKVIIPDNTARSPHYIPLAGIGSPANVQITKDAPKEFSFETTKIGKTSAPFVVNLKNQGSRGGTLSASLTGTNASEFEIKSNNCSSYARAFSDCKITVLFKPTEVPLDNTKPLEATLEAGEFKVKLKGTAAN